MRSSLMAKIIFPAGQSIIFTRQNNLRLKISLRMKAVCCGKIQTLLKKTRLNVSTTKSNRSFHVPWGFLFFHFMLFHTFQNRYNVPSACLRKLRINLSSSVVYQFWRYGLTTILTHETPSFKNQWIDLLTLQINWVVSVWWQLWRLMS